MRWKVSTSTRSILLTRAYLRLSTILVKSLLPGLSPDPMKSRADADAFSAMKQTPWLNPSAASSSPSHVPAWQSSAAACRTTSGRSPHAPLAPPAPWPRPLRQMIADQQGPDSNRQGTRQAPAAHQTHCTKPYNHTK